MSTRIDASCHCGNIRAAFESPGEVYVAAVMESGGKAFGILNLRAAGATPLLGREPVRVDYDAEAAEERRSRRERAWTPTTLRTAAP